MVRPDNGPDNGPQWSDPAMGSRSIRVWLATPGKALSLRVARDQAEGVSRLAETMPRNHPPNDHNENETDEYCGRAEVLRSPSELVMFCPNAIDDCLYG